MIVFIPLFFSFRYKEGTYLINTDDGSYTKLTSDNWSEARGICYLGNNLALCIYKNGIYHINTSDGLYTKLSSAGWEHSRGICYMGNNRALVLYKSGTYSINTKNGHWTKLSELGWNDARGLCCIYLKTDETYDMVNTLNSTLRCRKLICC